MYDIEHKRWLVDKIDNILQSQLAEIESEKQQFEIFSEKYLSFYRTTRNNLLAGVVSLLL